MFTSPHVYPLKAYPGSAVLPKLTVEVVLYARPYGGTPAGPKFMHPSAPDAVVPETIFAHPTTLPPERMPGPPGSLAVPHVLASAELKLIQPTFELHA